MDFAIGGIRLLDILDVVVVVYLMYLVYRLLKGTVAINIFLGVVVFYILYWLVGFLELELLSILLGNFVSIGVLILIIIFQPEVRRFLLMLGDTTLNTRFEFLDKFLGGNAGSGEDAKLIADTIWEAVEHLAETKTGALLVLTKKDVPQIVKTGTSLDAKVSAGLLESIFFKNSPLHDGAVILTENKLIAAGCILPVSENQNIPKDLGLRHRAAIGVTENTNLMAIVVSEETGEIAITQNGKYRLNLKQEKVIKNITKYLTK